MVQPSDMDTFEMMLDAAREEEEYELGASLGDPRRCPRHNVATSSPDGMFDFPCPRCEGEMSEAADRWDCDPENPRRRQCGLDVVTVSWRALGGDACVPDEIPF